MKVLATALGALVFAAACGLLFAAEAPARESRGAAKAPGLEAPSFDIAPRRSRGAPATPEAPAFEVASDGSGGAPETPGLEAQLSDVDVSGFLPEDLARPEGRTRWDLRGLILQAPWTRTLTDGNGEIAVRERRGAQGATLVTSTVYSDAAGGQDALVWLHPESSGDDLIPGSRRVLALDEEAAPETPSGRKTVPDHLWIEIETVGIGWVHLPDGPREVVLQRALILREKGGIPGYVPETLLHRWVARPSGVVAQVWGPPSADGRTRERISGATIAKGREESLSSLAKMYEGELIAPVRTAIGYGWDRGNVPISELTTQAYANTNALVAASTWDFTAGPASRAIAGTTTANNATTINGSGTAFQDELRLRDKIALSSAPSVFATVTNVNSQTQLTVSTALGNGTTQTILRKRAEVSNTSVPVNASETCNAAKCGYSAPGAEMDRLDRYFDEPAANRATTNAVRQRIETPGNNVTYWLRGGAQNEGLTGGLGEGESRFCYFSGGRTEVPLWRFPHQDAGGYYVQPGDTWTSSPFACEKNIFNGVCAADSCGFPCPLYLKSCTGYAGTQGGAAIKSGVVTLPSGHTFNAILFRTVAEFCVYIFSGCGTPVSQVRTVVYVWQVPHLGTVAEIDSPQNVPDPQLNFATADATILNFGLFPPRTIQATGATNTSVSLSWDPGLDTHRITGYRVYWDTNSGGGSPYAFSSTSHPGQVSFAGTTATISGLTTGTVYYFTVTALSTFTDPSSLVVTTYESLLYPTQVSGDPDRAYPVEVQAATTGAGCTPTAQVTGLTVNKQGTNLQFAWTPVADPCAVGYRVLASSTPNPPASFSRLADTGLATAWTGSTTAKFFLVVARGNNGNVGP